LVSIYRKSHELHDQGDVKGFTDSYLQAIEIQRRQQQSIGSDKEDLHHQILPYEMMVHIFSFLTHLQVGPLMLVNKVKISPTPPTIPHLIPRSL